MAGREREPAVGGRLADEVARPAAAQQQPAMRREVEHGDGPLEEDRHVVPGSITKEVLD